MTLANEASDDYWKWCLISSMYPHNYTLNYIARARAVEDLRFRACNVVP